MSSEPDDYEEDFEAYDDDFEEDDESSKPSSKAVPASASKQAVNNRYRRLMSDPHPYQCR